MRAVRGSFELHVFVAPLDPAPEHCERFAAACAAFEMKGLHLFLVYDQGPVGVLQSSAYVDGGLDDAVARCHAQAQHLRDLGFNVIREKIEALADNIGVPKTRVEAHRAPDDLYFEFHISVGGPEDRALDDGDRAFLEDLSRELSQRFATRVPLSWNAFKAAQRFLNVRTYQLGYEASMEIVEAIVQRSSARGLVVKKTIREFIVYDTNKDVDRGWVEDPLP